MDDKLNSIPKIIHYCWFGGNPLPKLALKCIESWKKYLPDYEIKEWNENNYDVRKIPYIAQAYDKKKFAFVSDYARFDILYQYGGIYFDTDVEVIKDLSPIIEKGAFAGVESPGVLASGLGLGSPAGTFIFKEIIESYKNSSFLRNDNSLNLTTVVERVSNIYKKYGFTINDEIQVVEGTTIYTSEYFCPLNPESGTLCITDNTYTIHHYTASWTIPFRKKYMTLRTKLASVIGIKMAKIILIPLQCICVIKEVGFKSFLKKI